MYEALTRLLIECFVNQTNSREAQLPNFNVEDTGTLDEMLTHDEFQDFVNGFDKFKCNIRNGMHGRTAQFWLIYYLDLMHCQHLIHKSVLFAAYDRPLTSPVLSS